MKVDENYEFERVERLMDDKSSIFVFGSNLAGIHGAGAAQTARELYGAESGIGEGPMHRCYAIPTRDRHISTLPLTYVDWKIGSFLDYARRKPYLSFIVTRVGCGYAGFKDEQIAPMFKGAPENCKLPIGWRAFNGEES